jgi:PAS domain S-box-containing protein
MLDVTDETKLERAERVAGAMGALFVQAPVPVFVVTRDGQFVSANGAATEHYGYSLAELLEMRVHDILVQPNPHLSDDLESAAGGSGNVLVRRPLRRKNGSVIWVVPTAGPVVVAGETYIVAVIKDVTALIEAEARARDATQASLRDRQLVLNAVVAMMGERELEPALTVLARAFGSAAGDLASIWLPETEGAWRLRPAAFWRHGEGSSTIPPDRRLDLAREQCSRRAWQSGVACAIVAADTAPDTMEREWISALGGTFVVAPLMGRAGPYGIIGAQVREGGDMERALAFATTLGSFGGLVLETVQLEARAERGQQRADMLWVAASERLTDGIALIDGDLRVLRVNSAFRSLLKVNEDQCIGKKCRDVFPLCALEDPCNHQVALASQRRLTREFNGIVSGRPIRIEIIPAPPNNAHFALIHVAHDLTDERAIRSQLITADRLASIGRLAAGVAHEVNNPAAFVTVNLGVLRDRFAAGATRPADVLVMLEESLTGMDRIREIVRDLKGLARERAKGRVDVSGLVASTLRMAAHETRGRARVERSLEPGLFAEVRGARIAQVVLNIVINAAQAIPAGNPSEQCIRVRAWRQKDATRDAGRDKVKIEVSDTGPGIAKEHAARIFEPFFTTREDSGGTGLGLWLAREIVEEEGGTIAFSNGPDGGARFVVELLASEGEPRADDAARETRETRETPTGRVAAES